MAEINYLITSWMDIAAPKVREYMDKRNLKDIDTDNLLRVLWGAGFAGLPKTFQVFIDTVPWADDIEKSLAADHGLIRNGDRWKFKSAAARGKPAPA